MLERKPGTGPLSHGILNSLTTNRFVHEAVNSAPVRKALKLGVEQFFVKPLQNPWNESVLCPPDQVLLEKLSSLRKLAFLLPARDTNYRFEEKIVGRLRKAFARKIETGEDNSDTLKIRRLLELMGPKYLRTFFNFAAGSVIGALNEGFLSKKDQPYFHFLVLQVNSDCNAKPRCPGCYAEKNQGKLDCETLDRLQGESAELGLRLTILLGGETLLEKNSIFKLLRKYKDSVFFLATNGMLVDKAYAQETVELGNVITFINIPGLEPTTTDIRRNPNAWKSIKTAAENLREYKAASGFISTVTRANYKDVSSPEFVQQMIDWGMMLGWYFGYTSPLDCSPKEELALTPEMEIEFSERVSEASGQLPMILINTIHGEQKIGGCPSASGKMVYVQANGRVAACPMAPLSRDDLDVGKKTLKDILKDPYFQSLREEHLLCVRDPKFLK